MSKFLSGRNDDRLDLRCEKAVRIRDGTLVLKIEHIADSTHNVMYAQFAAGIHGKFIILDDSHTLHTVRSLTYDIHTLVHIVESTFMPDFSEL